jgi:hypothetical protein
MQMNENAIPMFRGWLLIAQTERPLEVWVSMLPVGREVKTEIPAKESSGSPERRHVYVDTLSVIFVREDRAVPTASME